MYPLVLFSCLVFILTVILLWIIRGSTDAISKASRHYKFYVDGYAHVSR